MGKAIKHEFDSVIVGSGGAGLYAALEVSRDEGIAPRLEVLDDAHGAAMRESFKVYTGLPSRNKSHEKHLCYLFFKERFRNRS